MAWRSRGHCSTRSGTVTLSRSRTTAPASFISTVTWCTRSPARRHSRVLRHGRPRPCADRCRRSPSPDHNVPTIRPQSHGIEDAESRIQVETLARPTARDFGIPICSRWTMCANGIVHIIGPEQGLHPARHDHRLRRQPYRDPRRLRRPGLRHRHLGGRACPGHPDAASRSRPKTCASRRRRAAPGVTAKDLILAIIGEDRHGRRHRPRHRICRRRDPRLEHGRPHDGLQHVDRRPARAPA